MKNNRRPAASEHNPYFARYIDRVPETDVVAALSAQAGETAAFLATIGEEQSLHRYAPGKWSIREVVGHVTDAERVFAFRALAFARGDRTELPGFEENDYVIAGAFDAVPFARLVGALRTTRAATLDLLSTIEESVWDRVGIANGNAITVRALAYTIAGHERHHMAVIREKYLSGS